MNTAREQSTRSRASWPVLQVATEPATANTPKQQMLTRIDALSEMDLEMPVEQKTWDRARRVAWEIADFIANRRALPRPDIFASNGEVSFEWQAHRTGNVQAFAVLSADGATIELTILAGDATIPLYQAERAPESGIRTFLLTLWDAISTQR